MATKKSTGGQAQKKTKKKRPVSKDRDRKASASKAQSLREDIKEVLDSSTKPSGKLGASSDIDTNVPDVVDDAGVDQTRRPVRRVSARNFVHRRMRELDQ